MQYVSVRKTATPTGFAGTVGIGTVKGYKSYTDEKLQTLTKKARSQPQEQVGNKRKRDADENDGGQSKPAAASKKFKSSGNTSVDLNANKSDTVKFGEDLELNTHFKPKADCNHVVLRCLFSNTTVSNSGLISSDIKEELYKCLRRYGRGKPVVGCIAWLSDKTTLGLLRQAAGVSILVNREDYNVWGNGCVKKEYPTLPKMPQPMYKMFEHLGGILSSIERNRKQGVSSLFPVRAFGNSSEQKRPRGKHFGANFEGFGGLEHCKYLIFFEKGSAIRANYEKIGRSIAEVLVDYDFCLQKWSDNAWYPYYVWTGSMNLTGNAKNNHDNAVFGMDLVMGLSFFYDFSVTYVSSTPVFSNSKKSTPTMTVSTAAAMAIDDV